MLYIHIFIYIYVSIYIYMYAYAFVLKEDYIKYVFEKVCLHFNCCGNILKLCVG